MKPGIESKPFLTSPYPSVKGYGVRYAEYIGELPITVKKTLLAKAESNVNNARVDAEYKMPINGQFYLDLEMVYLNVLKEQIRADEAMEEKRQAESQLTGPVMEMYQAIFDKVDILNPLRDTMSSWGGGEIERIEESISPGSRKKPLSLTILAGNQLKFPIPWPVQTGIAIKPGWWNELRSWFTDSRETIPTYTAQDQLMTLTTRLNTGSWSVYQPGGLVFFGEGWVSLTIKTSIPQVVMDELWKQRDPESNLEIPAAPEDKVIFIGKMKGGAEFEPYEDGILQYKDYLKNHYEFLRRRGLAPTELRAMGKDMIKRLVPNPHI